MVVVLTGVGVSGAGSIVRVVLACAGDTGASRVRAGVGKALSWCARN